MPAGSIFYDNNMIIIFEVRVRRTSLLSSTVPGLFSVEKARRNRTQTVVKERQKKRQGTKGLNVLWYCFYLPIVN